MFRGYKFKNYNLRLVAEIFVLTVIGIMVIGSANSDYQNKQIIGMVLGLIVMVIVSLVDFEHVLQYHYACYGLTIALLLSTIVFGSEGRLGDAKRWIDLGFIRFQPSELAKVLLVLFFAKFLMRLDEDEDMNTPKWLAIIAILAGIPLVLIVIEPDLSTTIVTFLMLAAMIYMAGLSAKLVCWVLGLAIPAISVAIVMIDKGLLLKQYQALRILAWLHPEDYPSEAYQQQNSIMAVGGGQLFGKGLYNNAVDSVKNGNYISEPQTDFIFAVTGEELGFIGSTVVVILLLAITLECIRIGKKAKDLSGQLICVGMASLVGFQSFVNISVVTGIMPNTGLPLPFMSYGLTSLVTLYFGMGFVLNVGLQAKR